MTTPQHHLPRQTTYTTPATGSASASASSLPTARQFLTSLFNAISEIPLVGSRNSHNSDESSSSEGDDPPLPPPGGGNQQADRQKKSLSRRQRRLLLLQDGGAAGVGGITGPGGAGNLNVLKQVPVSHRHLIITLHVLFPGLVLPALDLLDRGLVGRIILQERKTVKKEEMTRTVKSEQGQRGLNVLEEWNTAQPNLKAEEDGHNGDDGGGFNQQPGDKQKEAAAAPSFYLVRSAQPTSHHHRRRRQQQNPRYGSGGEEDYPSENNSSNLFPGGQRAYIVRLDAWNCTCAAFAFASFLDPFEGEDTTTTGTTAKASGDDEKGDVIEVNHEGTVNTGSTTGQGMKDQAENQEMADRMDIDPPLPQAQEESQTHPNTALAADTAATISGTNEEGAVGDGEEGWSFGGMSLSQKGNGDDSPPPPLCKHLLACLLAGRWKDALGRYVVERQVSKEAMAGIVAEI